MTKRTAKIRTASGEIATPVECEPLKWLVRKSQHTWWVIELHSHDTRIQNIDLNNVAFGQPWSVSATARKLTKKYDESEHPGWHVEVSSNTSEPYSRMDDAVEAMLTEIAQNRRIREERQAQKTSAVSENHTDLRAQWSRIYLVTEYIDKYDTAEYRAAVAARTDASQEMVRRGLWRFPIGPSSTDPTWEIWYEVALEIYDREITYIARYTATGD